MNFRRIVFAFVLVAGLIASALPVHAQDWQAVQDVLGREGEVEDGILRVTVPRTDLDVEIDGTPVSEEMVAKAWFGFWPRPDGTVMLMGDVAMPAREMPAAQAALYREGLEMTALHNHLAHEEPRLLFMHVRGAGDAETLARKLRAVLDETNMPLAQNGETHGEEEEGEADWQAVTRVLGEPSEREGRVVEYVFPRADLLTMRGARLPATEALETAPEVAFQKLEDGRTATSGELFVRAAEVNPVAEALQANGITVTAVHHHMLQVEPRMFWMHWWATGEAGELARGVRAALEEVNLRASALPPQ